MKKYNKPEIKVNYFENKDVVATSCNSAYGVAYHGTYSWSGLVPNVSVTNPQNFSDIGYYHFDSNLKVYEKCECYDKDDNMYTVTDNHPHKGND